MTELKPIDKSKLSPLNRKLVEGMEQIFGVTFVDVTPPKWTRFVDEWPMPDKSLIVRIHKAEYFGTRVEDEDGEYIDLQDIETGRHYGEMSLSIPFNDPDVFWRYFDE